MAEIIKAVVFDWGGVLIDDPAYPLVQYFAKALSVNEADYQKAYQEFQEDFHKGFITESKFWDRMCARLNVPKPKLQSLWGQGFKAVYSPKRKVFSLAKQLRRKGYRIGLLSNTEEPSMCFFYKQGYDIFDVLVFSCEEEMLKPQKTIYKRAVERLRVKPQEVVFIDNNPEFIDGAKQAGLNAILFEDIEQLKKDLARLSVKVE
jgi:putative hydrolase of the HAD superfamily